MANKMQLDFMSVALPLFSHSSQDQNWREKKLIRFWWFDGVIVVVVECFCIISPLECIRFVPREWKQQIPSKLCKHNICILLRWLFVTILFSFLPYRKIHIGTGTCLCAHYLFLVNEKHAHTQKLQAFSILSHWCNHHVLLNANCAVCIYRLASCSVCTVQVRKSAAVNLWMVPRRL